MKVFPRVKTGLETTAVPEGPGKKPAPTALQRPDAPLVGPGGLAPRARVTDALAYIQVVALEILRDGVTTAGHRLAAAVGRSRQVGAPLDAAPPDMRGKVCVVTGANSGIGFSTAERLARLGGEVVLVCRNPAKGAAALAELEARVPDGRFRLVLGDLGDQASARDLGGRLAEALPRVDVLVNNAGMLATTPGATPDGIDRSLQVNHLGPAEVTLALRDALTATGGRVVHVSSGMHHQGALERDSDRFSITRSYADTKLRHLTFTAALADQLRDDGVTVHAVHPGAVRTNIASGGDAAQRILSTGLKASGPLVRSADRAAEDVAWIAAAPEPAEHDALYWFDRAPAKPAAAVTDPEARQAVWSETLSALGRV